tara:strand:+ start:1014 stop:1124 length:111 start_codon:yes stop_codon:yes gene_type:complete
MGLDSRVRIEKKNYNEDIIETIIHLKNKDNVIFEKS